MHRRDIGMVLPLYDVLSSPPIAIAAIPEGSSAMRVSTSARPGEPDHGALPI
jgi:hypothetical protein